MAPERGGLHGGFPRLGRWTVACEALFAVDLRGLFRFLPNSPAACAEILEDWNEGGRYEPRGDQHDSYRFGDDAQH